VHESTYVPGTHLTFGCNASKNCFKDFSLPDREKTILVSSFTPVQSRTGTFVGLAVGAGVLEWETWEASPLEDVH